MIRRVEGVTGVQEPQVVFDTEDEAVREAGKLLKELRRDAIFREKYASDLSNAVKALDREDQLHEARKHRAIAEEGLKLLGIQLAEADDGIEFTAVNQTECNGTKKGSCKQTCVRISTSTSISFPPTENELLLIVNYKVACSSDVKVGYANRTHVPACCAFLT